MDMMQFAIMMVAVTIIGETFLILWFLYFIRKYYRKKESGKWQK